jgi:hypothetical protein
METKDKGLPWYLNGTLDEASHREIEHALRSSPHAQAEALWLGQIQEQVRSEKDMQQLPSPDAGLDRLMALIEGERSRKVVSLPRLPQSVGRWYRPAFGIAAAVIATQALLLGIVLQNGTEADLIKSLSGHPSVQEGALLQITFKSNATEPQIRATLALIGGDIVGGPGVIGLYTVRVAASQAQSALVKLGEQKGVVDSAALLRN